MHVPRLSLDRIAQAAERIDPVFTGTPQFVSEPLSRRLGVRVLTKVETLNPIRSFKGRGADCFVQAIGGRRTELVCASAGNFGQGLAYAARRRGHPVHVFAAHAANPLKVERMRDLGATLHLVEGDFDSAKDAARAFAAAGGGRFVEDGREPAISEGAGTIAVELCRWPAPLDAVVVPLGNGALLGGMAAWLREHAPGTRIVGVSAAGAPAMERSWRAGRPVETAEAATVADGIAVRVPVPEAVADLAGTVDDVLLVDDDAILAAVRLLFEELGLVVEPAGAVGIAALLTHGAPFAGRLVATPLCGGNLTAEQVARWLLPAPHPR
jgi:threonine dehydratase